jgi:hypothetical protein
MKMALAAVVSLFDNAKETTVAAYASAVSHTAKSGLRRASRTATNKNNPAISERPPAICQPESWHNFMAAPAVDQSAAAARINKRLLNMVRTREAERPTLSTTFPPVSAARYSAGAPRERRPLPLMTGVPPAPRTRAQARLNSWFCARSSSSEYATGVKINVSKRLND